MYAIFAIAFEPTSRRAQRTYYDTKMQRQWTMIELKMGEEKNEIKREPESMYLY